MYRRKNAIRLEESSRSSETCPAWVFNWRRSEIVQFVERKKTLIKKKQKYVITTSTNNIEKKNKTNSTDRNVILHAGKRELWQTVAIVYAGMFSSVLESDEKTREYFRMEAYF